MSVDQFAAMDEEPLDGEGVWAPDIERAFHEALAEYPACGRRKHILQDEGGGKMYGRNELIARHIYLQTGKHRTRKQVSSHIQVLARRKAKLAGGSLTSPDLSAGTPSPAATAAAAHAPARPLPGAKSDHRESSWSERPVASARLRLVEFAAFVERPAACPRLGHNPPPWQHHHHPLYDPYRHSAGQHVPAPNSGLPAARRHDYVRLDYARPPPAAAKLERIAISQVQDKFSELGGTGGLSARCPSDAIYLIKFWVDFDRELERQLDDDQNSRFGFSSRFETYEPAGELRCSTRACSYGRQVVEQLDRMRPAYNLATGRYSYAVERSPMCEFMIQFIRKLRQLPRVSQMNSVLENFTILQVITSESSSEVLLCLAFVFEINSEEQNSGPQHRVYKLTKD